MTTSTVVGKEQLKGIFDVDKLLGSRFLITISPISETEADEHNFNSLKGVAEKPLNLDDIRAERLHL